MRRIATTGQPTSVGDLHVAVASARRQQRGRGWVATLEVYTSAGDLVAAREVVALQAIDVAGHRIAVDRVAVDAGACTVAFRAAATHAAAA